MATFSVPNIGDQSVAPSISPSIGADATLVDGTQLDIVDPGTLLGATLKADWDSRAGVAATWTDQIGSRVLTNFSGTTTFGADGSFFNGQSVWLMGAGAGMGSPMFTAIATTGNNDIWVTFICRLLAPQLSQPLVYLTDNGNNPTINLLQTASGSGNVTASTITAPFVPDTNVHRYEYGIIGGRSMMFIDGSLRASGATFGTSLARDLTRVQLPRNAASGSAGINVASLRIITPAPTGLQRAQLRAYDSSIWGTL